ncbi:complex I subunit 5 family protein [Phytoactinopolyspora mesophila]|uniref:Formate hydrogenlyase n=1 Tax=Phytoactinopolyspora mesophila TaxID=2650750 RepID=A0A7K3M678_9ACTN|nr:complex I subunit 5 family protein [Phytoactinopolyspora mesophila]NDL57938.1 formate hydrogenlyase [Phytoactinopolyspora mesophila]
MITLWLLAVLAPLLTALAIALGGLAPAAAARAGGTVLTRIAPLAPLPAGLLAVVGTEHSRIELPWLLMGTVVELDSVGRPLLLMASLLYAAALAFVPRSGIERPALLSGLLLLCFVGNAGVFIAADAVTLYLTFTLMSFVGYAAVIHDRSGEARRAGRIYLVMAVLGEAAVLAAVILVVGSGGVLLSDAPAAVAGSPYRDVIIALLLFGFGVKAGTVPLHVWLPLAHPAAPTPASAILSGAMVTAGLVGWLRFLPLGEIASPGWGTVFVLAALLGAFLAVPAGLLQSDPKVILAYSTISQMGFLAVLVGVALAEPELAPVCILAAALYALHHGIAKGALFLGIPLWKSHGGGSARIPLLAGLGAAALAIIGVPLTSGYVAKYVAKEAVGPAMVPAAGGVELAEVLPLVGAGSTLLLARCAWVLLRPSAGRARPGPALPVWLLLVAGGFALTAAVAHRWTGTIAVPKLTDMSIWWEQSWPLLLGLVLTGAGWWVSSRDLVPPWAAHPDGRTVPPGDVVVVEEELLRRVAHVLERVGAALLAGHVWVLAMVRRMPSVSPIVGVPQRILDGWRESGLVLLLLLALCLALVVGGLS